MPERGQSRLCHLLCCGALRIMPYHIAAGTDNSDSPKCYQGCAHALGLGACTALRHCQKNDLWQRWPDQMQARSSNPRVNLTRERQRVVTSAEPQRRQLLPVISYSSARHAKLKCQTHESIRRWVNHHYVPCKCFTS